MIVKKKRVGLGEEEVDKKREEKWIRGDGSEWEAEEEDEESYFSYASQLANSIVLPMALQLAAELGVFDVFQKEGPNAKISANHIASSCNCNCNCNCNNPIMLNRILSLLASHSLLKCSLLQDPQNLSSSQRLYTAAPVARFFASDSHGVSLRPLITLHHHNNFLTTWSQLKDAIREGGIPRNKVHKSPHLDSDFNQILNTALNNHSTLVMNKVLQRYKGFENIKRVVDVGGGLGININLITSKYPHIHGINFDLPHVIQQAPSYPGAGVEHVGGDMFESVPKGDAIFMKWIIHYWSDQHCLKLLKNCFDATPHDGKVIVLEAILPIIPQNNAVSKAISQSDVLMMTRNRGGRERTEQEFMDLATGAGFSGIRYQCYVCTFWVMEFFK